MRPGLEAATVPCTSSDCYKALLFLNLIPEILNNTVVFYSEITYFVNGFIIKLAVGNIVKTSEICEALPYFGMLP